MIATVAAEANVPVAAVSLTVEAASVRLSFEITVPTLEAATAASNAIGSRLATPTAASAFLTTASYTPTVQTIPIAPAVPADGAPVRVDGEAAAQRTADDSAIGVLPTVVSIAAAVAAIALLLAVFVYVKYMRVPPNGSARSAAGALHEVTITGDKATSISATSSIPMADQEITQI